MKTKYEVGQEVITNVRVTETVSSIEINSHGTIYHLLSGKVYSEMVLASIENKPTQPIAPQEDKPKYAVGQKVKVIGNCCCHGYSRDTILTLVRSVNFLRREPDWYVGEGTDYVSERDIGPCAEPEKEPEPVYLNMKVVCTDGDSSFYAGKVYEFINGKVKDKDGDERPQPLNPTSGRASNFEQFYKAYCGEAKFIPYLGEQP